MKIPDSKIAEIIHRHIEYFDLKWYKKHWDKSHLSVVQGFERLSISQYPSPKYPYYKIVQDLKQEEINMKMELIRQASEL